MKNTIMTAILFAAVALVPACDKGETQVKPGSDTKTDTAKTDDKKGDTTAAAKPADAPPKADDKPADKPADPAAGAAGWQKVTSPEGGFSIKAPTKGTQSLSSTDTPAGPAKTTTIMYSPKTDNGALMVMFMDMPVADGTPLNVEKGLEDGRDRAVGTYKGKLLSDKRIDVNGNPAREFTFEANMPGAGKVHAIMRGAFRDKRIYMVGGVSMANDAAYRKKSEDFVHSFEILPHTPTNKTKK